MNLKAKKMRHLSLLLTLVLVFTQVIFMANTTPASAAELGSGSGSVSELDADWADISSFISTLNGRYTAPPPAVVMDSFTSGMLLGNGDIGVVTGGSYESMKYYISNNEMWNNNGKIMIGNLTIEPTIIKGNVAAARNCTFSGYYSNNVMGDSALDSNDSSIWQDNSSGDKWLAVDLGRPINITRWVVKHYGYNGLGNTQNNLSDFKLQSSNDGSNWTDADTVTGNTDSLTSRNITGTLARYWRLYITDPGSDNVARVREFELYSDMTGGSIDPKAVYDSTVDIKNAEVTSNLGMGGLSTLSFNTWTADSENLFVVEITNPAEGAPVTLDANLWVPKKSSYPYTAGVTNGALCITRDNMANPSSTDYLSRVGIATKILGSDFSSTTSDANQARGEFTIVPGSTVKIVTSLQHNAGISTTTGADILAASAIDRVTGVTSTDLDGLKVAHRNWWKDYWLKSYVRLNDTVMDKYYYGALYAFGCASRPGEVCPGLWANFNTTDTGRWGGQYTTNYNVEATYYGIFSSNRVEYAEPYVNLISAERPWMENYAAKAGYKGAASIRNLKPFNMYKPAPAPISKASTKDYNSLPADQKSNGSFTALPILWDYEYTLDDTFLKNTAYPLIKDFAEFWSDYVTWDGTRYVVLHSGGNEGGDDTNPNLDVGYARTMLREAIDMSTKLGVDADLRANWQNVLDKFSDFATQQFNGKSCFTIAETIKNSSKPWYIEMNGQPINLEGLVFPGENLSLGGDHTMLQNVINTLDYQQPWCLDASSNYNGFPKTWPIAARVGYPAADLKAKFKTAITAKWRENLTVSQPGGGLETVGSIEGVDSMLMQSENGLIRIFPSWPASDDAYFKRLRAKGAFLVDSRLTNGTVEYVNLKSEKGAQVRLEDPWGSRPVKVARIDDQGNELGDVLYSVSGKNIVFNTTSGDRYKITETDVAPDGVVFEADKTLLAKAINQALKLNSGNFYTVEEYNTFSLALSTAQSLNDDPAAIQDAVDNATAGLNTSMSHLFYAADKSGLEKAITEAAKLGSGNFYINEDWTSFQTALSTAKSTDSDHFAAQSAVDKATADLNAAMKKVKQAGGYVPTVDISGTNSSYTIYSGRFVQLIASVTNPAWSVQNPDGSATTDAVIDPIGGILYASKEGTYKVTAAPSAGTTKTANITFSNMSPAGNLTSNGNGNGSPIGQSTSGTMSYLMPFDGNPATFYEANKTGPYVGWDFGQNPKIVNVLKFIPRSGSNALRVNGAKFQGSNDGTNYTDLCTIADIANTSSTQPWYIKSFTNSTAYRYYRWLGADTTRANVAEIEMYTNVDKTALGREVAFAQAQQAGNYTDASWQQLQSALTSVSGVNSDQFALQADIDACADTLKTAIDGLQVIPGSPRDIANHITSIEAPVKDAASLVFPEVSSDFTVDVKSSDNTAVIDTEGNIMPPDADRTVNIVLTVTRVSDELSAETASIPVVVPAGTSAAEVAAGITSVAAPAKDATSLTLPDVPDGFTVEIHSLDNTGVIATDGTITPQEKDTTVNLVLRITKTTSGRTADTAGLSVTVPARTPPVSADITSISAAYDGQKTITVTGTAICSDVMIAVFDSKGQQLFMEDSAVEGGSFAKTFNAYDVLPIGTYTVKAANLYGDSGYAAYSFVAGNPADVAKGISSIPAPAKDATSLTLPEVLTGYTVEIISSDKPEVIGIDGRIIPPLVDTIVNLVLRITGLSDGSKANTAPIAVNVPAGSQTTPPIDDSGPSITTGNGGNTGGTAPESGNTGSTTTVTSTHGTTVVAGNVKANVDASGKAKASISAAQSSEILTQLNNTASNAPVKVQINVSADAGAKELDVSVPKTIFNRISESQNNSVAVSSGIGSVTFSSAAVDAINSAATGDITISIAKSDAAALPDTVKEVVGNHPVYNFTVEAGSGNVSNFGGNVTVAIPYTPAANEDKNAIVVYYIDQNGKLTTVNISDYNPATGLVSFVTTHFSQYAVGYRKVDFSDTAGNWSKDSITYLAARNVISGVGNGKFAPNEGIKRAQFAKMLAGIMNADVSGYTSSRFSDVPQDAWYAPYVAWAAEKGIVNGLGNGKFDPNASVTREQMATMIVRFSAASGCTLPANTEQTAFADGSRISTWAAGAVAAVQRAGIISGKPGNIFDPKTGATRAEAAKMLTVLMEGMNR